MIHPGFEDFNIINDLIIKKIFPIFRKKSFFIKPHNSGVICTVNFYLVEKYI